MRYIILTSLIFFLLLNVNGQKSMYAVRTKYVNIIEGDELTSEKAAIFQETYRGDFLLRKILYNQTSYQPEEIIYYYYNQDSTQLLLEESYNINNELVLFKQYSYKKDLLKNEIASMVSADGEYVVIENKQIKRKKGKEIIVVRNGNKDILSKTIKEVNADGMEKSITTEYLINDSLNYINKTFIYNEEGRLDGTVKDVIFKDGSSEKTETRISYMPNGKVMEKQFFLDGTFQEKQLHRYYNNGLLRMIITLDDENKTLHQVSFNYDMVKVDFVPRQPKVKLK